MIILDGKILNEKGRDRLAEEVTKLGFAPTLAILQIGSEKSSDAYIGRKKKFAESIGAKVMHRRFEEGTDEQKLFFEIERLNKDATVHGIIIQFPIPKNYDKFGLVEAVSPMKDVDGLTSFNLKKLLEKKRGMVPATAKGVLSLLDNYGVIIEGRRAVVIGRSVLAGESIALSLLNRDATVTIAHSKTVDLEKVAKEADILVVAVGRPKFVTADYVRSGQTVVDVGISIQGGEKIEEEITGAKLVGDVDYESVSKVVGAISPVPGGVGPMTVLSLFENLLEAAERQKIIK